MLLWHRAFCLYIPVHLQNLYCQWVHLLCGMKPIPTYVLLICLLPLLLLVLRYLVLESITLRLRCLRSEFLYYLVLYYLVSLLWIVSTGCLCFTPELLLFVFPLERLTPNEVQSFAITAPFLSATSTSLYHYPNSSNLLHLFVEEQSIKVREWQGQISQHLLLLTQNTASNNDYC